MNISLYLEGNMNTKNLLFYKQKIILLENPNSFVLNENNFLQHQIDQNNKIVLKRRTLSPLKIMKNPFYFTSKALFVLKIFKFLF